MYRLTPKVVYVKVLNVFNIPRLKTKIAVPEQSASPPHSSRSIEKVSRSEATQEQILDTAIGLFRKGGFDETTMREVASEAGVALGLGYHYFPSKEALVMAYYQRVQREHRIVAHEKLAHTRPPRSSCHAVAD